MNDPNSAIPAEATPAAWRRYDEWRARRHQRFAGRTAHRLPRWRNRRGYRRLVILQLISLVVVFVGVGTAYVSMQWVLPTLVLGLVGAICCQYMLRIVTGSVADTPVPALDEIQLAQRNSARSIGFIVLFGLMFIPYLVLIALGTQDEVRGQLVYGTGVLMIALMLAAGLLPTMLTAWWMSDPDPDDFASPAGDVHRTIESQGGLS